MINILLTQNLPVENQQISISYAVDMSTEWVKENKVAKKQQADKFVSILVCVACE